MAAPQDGLPNKGLNMKKIFVLFFFLVNCLSAQSFYQKLLDVYSDEIIYNGNELLSNSIDRDLELSAAIYTSDFSAGTNSWTGLRGTATGNIDGIAGQNDCIRHVVDNTSNNHPLIGSFITTVIGTEYRVTFDYYIPNTNSHVNGIRLFSGDGNTFSETSTTNTLNAWTTYWVNVKATATTGIRLYPYNGINVSFQDPGGDDPFYAKNIKVIKVSNYIGAGNHSVDTSYIKQAGTYGLKITSSGTGNGSTNTISLASSLFTAVTSGVNYRFQVYAYTSTANTTLTFKLGDILLTKNVPTSGMNVLNFDFKATASTTGNIYLYTNQAATVYLDEASFKSGQ